MTGNTVRFTLDEREIEAISELLRTSHLQIGDKVAEFEAKVAALMAKRHGVMVNSGTSAIYLALDLLDLQPGDEIITSVLTFSADITPMVRAGVVPASTTSGALPSAGKWMRWFDSQNSRSNEAWMSSA